MSLKLYTGSGDVEVESIKDEHGREHRWNCKGACKACKAKTSVKGTKVQVRARGVWSYAIKANGGRVYAIHNGTVIVPCRGCNKPRYAREVHGIVNTAKFCDARCMNAIGPSCECACGGLNHGGGHDNG